MLFLEQKEEKEMIVYIGSDREGHALKETVKNYLTESSFNVVDVSQETYDAVDVTLDMCDKLLQKEDSLGIVIDGYGVASFMAATKVKGMVAAQVSDERSAYMTREHNNSRLITMGSEIVGETLAKQITLNFLQSDYAGGRHQIRVDMLNKLA